MTDTIPAIIRVAANVGDGIKSDGVDEDVESKQVAEQRVETTDGVRSGTVGGW